MDKSTSRQKSKTMRVHPLSIIFKFYPFMPCFQVAPLQCGWILWQGAEEQQWRDRGLLLRQVAPSMIDKFVMSWPMSGRGEHWAATGACTPTWTVSVRWWRPWPRAGARSRPAPRTGATTGSSARGAGATVWTGEEQITLMKQISGDINMTKVRPPV